MNFQTEFNKIMENEENIALASCVDNIPNVRIVNFYYDIKKTGLSISQVLWETQKQKSLKQITG